MRAGILYVPMDTVAFKGPPTLDAIIGGILYSRDYNGPEAAKAPQIARIDDIPQASCAVVVGETNREICAVTRSFSSHLRANPELITAVANPRWSKSVQKTDYGYQIMNQYEVRSIQGLLFFAVCDAEAVVEMVTECGAIGSNRKSFGKITGEVEWMDLPERDHFAISSQGQLLRPVPSHRLADFGVEEAPARYGFYQNPYSPEVARKAGIHPTQIATPYELAANDIHEAIEKYQ